MEILKTCILLGVLLCIFSCVVEAKKKRSSHEDFDISSDERLCQRKRCGKKPKGSMCQIVTEDGKKTASCVCPTACNATDVSQVCSVFGRQYENKCFLHKEACRKKKNIKVAYDGPCIASQLKCRADELRQFPFRLLDWFIHLKDRDEFGTVDPRKTITTISLDERRNAATWKFQQLDKNSDGKLNVKELKQFRYALMPLEHCAKDFFKKCDKNKNKKMEEKEWQTCLVDDGWEWFQKRSGSKHSRKEADDSEDIQ